MILSFKKLKKGQFSAVSFIYYILFAIFLTVGFLVLIALFDMLGNATYKISDNTEMKLITERILSSPRCFPYQDEVGRTYFNTINLEKFTNEIVDDCLLLDKKYPYEFLFVLAYEKEIIKNQNKKNEIITKVSKTSNWFGEEFEKAWNIRVVVYDEQHTPYLGLLKIKMQRTQRHYS